MWRVLKIIVLSVFIPLFSCNKNDQDQLLGAGVFLSTDVHVATWYPLRSYFKENRIKITFYIDAYDRINEADKAMMLELQADGHEIAHHSRTHQHTPEQLKKLGETEYLNQEITSIMDSMIKDGFVVSAFAYPFGDCSVETDRLLLKKFKSVRKIISPYAGQDMEDVDAIYYRFKGNRLFYGSSIDRKNNYKTSEILHAIEKAADSKQTISLYCHEIDYTGTSSNSLSINKDVLIEILNKAKRSGLTFYTASQMAGQ